MAEIVKVDLTTLTTVAGVANVHVADTTTAAVYWRRYNSFGVYIEQFLGTANGAGNWYAEVPDGRYKCFTTVHPSTSGEVIKWHGATNKFRWVGDSILPYLPQIEAANDYNAGGFLITNVADGVNSGDAINLLQTETMLADYRLLSDTVFTALQVGTLEATQLGADLAAAGWRITGLSAPLVGSGAATKAYVDAITVVPYQESVNGVRLMIGGTQQTNQVYTTYAAVMGWAVLQSPGATWKITINIEGMGNAGATSITMTNATSGVYIDDYISLNGKNHSIVLIPPDDNVTVSTLGNSIISNLKIFKNDAGSDPIFTNIEFNNVAFDLTVNSVTFNNCKFINCTIKVNTDLDATATFTTCKGASTTSNQDFGSSTIDGWVKPKADF